MSRPCLLVLRVVGLASLLSLSTLASNSLVLNSSSRVQAALPNLSAYSALRDWRIEGQADNWVNQGTRVGLWEIDSSASVTITAENALQFLGFHNEGVSIPLKSTTSFRWVAQSNTATGKYTLELWDQQTGNYTYAEVAMNSTASVDRRNYRVSIGSFYEPTSPVIHLGFVRWYSSTRPLGGAPPALLTVDFAELMDFEFERSLLDLSPSALYLAFSVGSAEYATTASFAPAVNLGATPLTARAGKPIQLDASGSFSNSDSPGVSCIWSDTVRGSHSVWTGQFTCTPTVVPSVFGTYNLRVTVIDLLGQRSTKDFKIGAVATDDNDVVIVPDARIGTILGPMIRFGANPWSWFDNRQKKLADNQIALMNTVWADYWNTPSSHGTVSVTAGSVTVNGSGTSFQDDFCGGAGNTTPADASSIIYFWYPSTDYPGETGRGRYTVVQCNSQTQLTISQPYIHSATGNSLPYTVVNQHQEANWVYAPIPGNYYDNVLAFYNLYYRTGLDTYRDAARVLASRFWTGPNFDRGQNYNFERLGGTWSIAGPGRGQSVTGLALWGLETGTDVWKGLHYVWNSWALFSDYTRNGGQMGNIREHGYFDAGLALCMLFDPDDTYSKGICPTALSTTIRTLWAPLETQDGAWTNTEVDVGLLASDGSISVTVVDGSPNITLTNQYNVSLGSYCAINTGWCPEMFSNSGTLMDRWLWFITNPRNVNLSGNSSAAVGDTTVYKVSSVVDGTHAVLSKPYSDSKCPAPNGCKKGLVASHIAGFGTQPFMLGLAIGVFADYVYKALVYQNMLDDAATVRQFVVDGAKWLSTTGYDPKSGGLWGARGFLNCEPDPSVDPYCQSGAVLNGEAMRGYSAAYLLTGDPAIKAAGDRLYQRQWCKPGWSCPLPADGSYLQEIDDPPGGYMINNSALSNKWFGFFFGYGFGAAWPAARISGVAPVASRDYSIPVNLGAVPSAAKLQATTIGPDGKQQVTTCLPPACQIRVDARQGDSLLRIDYLNNAGLVVRPGDFAVMPVNP